VNAVDVAAGSWKYWGSTLVEMVWSSLDILRRSP
jgi:hypothetical protein